ncbi:hypothetical protein JCM3774_005493 [Rhodotorula dairenensis]
MAPSSGLSVLTKALHAATGPDPTASSHTSESASASSPSRASLSHTASEFGRHLKRALHDEWHKPPHEGARPPLRHPTDPQSSYATARSAISSGSAISSSDSVRRVPPLPPPPQRAQSGTGFLPPRGVPGGPPVDSGEGDATIGGPQSSGPSSKRKNVDQVEADQMQEAMRASLRDGDRKQQPGGDAEDEALHQALVESEADERHRLDAQATRERAEFALALAASRRSPSPPTSAELYDRPTPTSSRPHSPDLDRLPAFSDADLARAAYPVEKATHHPQGRPALPPGAGGAWDDEMREMEMLALAIRISQEEEEERNRIDERLLGEALRQSEREVTEPTKPGAPAPDTDSASATSSLAPRIAPGSGGGGGGDDMSLSPTSSDGSFSAPAPLPHPSPRSRRASWIKPPLASSMSRSGSSSSMDSAAAVAGAETAAPPPPRPPRPTLPQLDAAKSASVSAKPSSEPHTRNWPTSPPKPNRAPPPPPPGAAPASLAPLPRFEPAGADERWRQENDGSPREMPNLTPSSSIRGHHAAAGGPATNGFANRPTAYSLFGIDPHGEPHNMPDQLARRPSQASTGSYATALSDPLGDEDETAGLDPPPLSPLNIRNPDVRGPTSSDGSRSSTLSSTTSAESGDNMQHDPAWNGGNAPAFPAGPIGFSSTYAGRSMSAISELTEPVSSAAATEDGGSERVIHGGPSRADSFPSTVSLDPSDSTSEEHGGEVGQIAEQDWFAGGGRNREDAASTPRPAQTSFGALMVPPAPVSSSATADPNRTPPSGDPSGHSPTIRQGNEPKQAVTTPLAQDDGLRCGYPAECARELDHVCPADGLSAAAGIPETVELASDLPPNHTSWAIEAHSWVALVRALMWYGDTVVTASADDLAESPSKRCAATAALEFRSDDEDIPVLRLVLALMPPRDPASHHATHRELRVQKSQHDGGGKGKGKAKAGAPPASSFLLPDVVHLPARLSSLAIQLYSLRHLASIARATQPSTPVSLQASTTATVEGYPALRELADAISALAHAAQTRRYGNDGAAPGEPCPPSMRAAGSGGVVAAAPDQTERLVDRLRARLRGLKRNRTTDGVHTSSEDEDAGADRNLRGVNKLVKPGRRDRSSSQPAARVDHLSGGELRATNAIEGTSGDASAREGPSNSASAMRYMPVLRAS